LTEAKVHCIQLAGIQRTIAMAIIDIDFFKEYNDFYGHLAGDKCLTRYESLFEAAVKALYLSKGRNNLCSGFLLLLIMCRVFRFG